MDYLTLTKMMSMTKQDKKKEYDNIVKRIDKAEEYFRNQPYNADIDNTKEWKALLGLIEKANELHYELFYK